jgi:hypothetical protein
MSRRRRCGHVAFGLWPNVVEPQARRYNDLGMIGERARLACSFGRRARNSVGQTGLLRVFGATPKTATGTVALPGFWMIFQPLRSWLISGFPLGQVRTKFHEGEMKVSSFLK